MLDLGQDESQSRRNWPRLLEGSFVETSDVDKNYNCAAWAAGITTMPWWPWTWPYYWPPEAPMQENIAAFVAAYRTLDYDVCPTSALEPGFEKIAVYSDSAGTPTHVARQLSDGRWTSKLGDLKDITHSTLDDLAGGEYGTPALFMRRPRVQEVSQKA